jgi:TPR repeat protein
MYFTGTDSAKDEQKAAEWFEKAAELGNVNAQSSIGMFYLLGQDVMKDEKKSVE